MSVNIEDNLDYCPQCGGPCTDLVDREDQLYEEAEEWRRLDELEAVKEEHSWKAMTPKKS